MSDDVREKWEPYTLMLPPQLRTELERLAELHDRTVAGETRRALTRYVEAEHAARVKETKR